MESGAIPTAIRDAYGLGEARAERVSAGWINHTFCIERDSERFVLQRLHPVFRGELNLDIDAITSHLHARGFCTPRLVRTKSGHLWVEEADFIWRLLTFVEGRTLHALEPALAQAAAELVGRFHRAVSDLEYSFHFTRPGAHDTQAHLTKLRRLRDGAHLKTDPTIRSRADAVLQAAEELPPLPRLPLRIIHGDLKATNILFERDRDAARALVDLDTLAHGTIAVELGDALRSWCNRTSESDPDARFDVEVFEAAMVGYATGAPGLLRQEEVGAIVPGAEIIAVELASRFAADLYEDAYFGWDATRFASRREHNLARVDAQLSLARSVRERRGELSEIAHRALG